VNKAESESELAPLDDKTRQKLHDVLTWEYEFAAAKKRAAKSSVTALRRQAEKLDDEAEQQFQVPSFQFSVKQREIPTRQLKIRN